MDYSLYNEKRYRRRYQAYRCILGLQQMFFHPVLFLIWIPFSVGVGFYITGIRIVTNNVSVYPLFITAFRWSMKLITILFPIICAVAMLQLIGHVAAVKDESNLSIVFAERREIRCQPPILVYKRVKKNGVIQREFDTIIPLEYWRKKQEEISDRFNIRLITDITYGGRNRNKGYRIYFEAVKGRKPKESGVLYDDTL